MTDRLDSLADPSDDDLAALAAMLARADTWDQPPLELEDLVVSAIAAEADSESPLTSVGATSATSLVEHRARRGTRMIFRKFAAAAAIAVIVAGAVALTRGGSDGVTIALAGTATQPGASGEVRISATPAGMKILLDTDGLPGAPDGYMYEAWVGNDDFGVSAGTFHLRGGDGPIELWAGVNGADFHRFWITLEPIDDNAASSSDARLRGEFSLSDD